MGIISEGALLTSQLFTEVNCILPWNIQHMNFK